MSWEVTTKNRGHPCFWNGEVFDSFDKFDVKAGNWNSTSIKLFVLVCWDWGGDWGAWEWDVDGIWDGEGMGFFVFLVGEAVGSSGFFWVFFVLVLLFVSINIRFCFMSPGLPTTMDCQQGQACSDIQSCPAIPGDIRVKSECHLADQNCNQTGLGLK